MTYALEAGGAEYELHFDARSRAESAFLDGLEKNPRVRLHFDDGPDEQRLRIATDLGQPDPDTALYVCGPGDFMDFVISSARDAGWPAEAILKERFAPVEDTVAHTAGASFRVRPAKSGGEYEVKDGESALDVLLASGVDAPYSCRQGICGECIVRVLARELDHRDDILTKSTGAIEAVEQAEAAWLTALTKGEEAINSLMLEDSRAVHGPVGKIDDRETFAHFTWTRRRHVFAKAEDLGTSPSTRPPAVPGAGGGDAGVGGDRGGLAPGAPAPGQAYAARLRHETSEAREDRTP